MKNKSSFLSFLRDFVIVIVAFSVARWVSPNNFWPELIIGPVVAVGLGYVWRKVVDDPSTGSGPEDEAG